MNEKLLEYAKEAGFVVIGNHIHASYEHPRYSEIYVEITKELTKLAALVQANTGNDADAKLKLAVDALKAMVVGQSSNDYKMMLSSVGMATIAKQALEKIGE